MVVRVLLQSKVLHACQIQETINLVHKRVALFPHQTHGATTLRITDPGFFFLSFFLSFLEMYEMIPFSSIAIACTLHFCLTCAAVVSNLATMAAPSLRGHSLCRQLAGCHNENHTQLHHNLSLRLLLRSAKLPVQFLPMGFVLRSLDSLLTMS